MTENNRVLLGKAIRAFREQTQPNKISQFRLATLMNWEGTAPVIEIEKGRRLPRPETLNAIGEALQLSHADIAYLHGLAGYRGHTVMPPAEQLKRSLHDIEVEINRLRYPVYVLDYQFSLWLVNLAGQSFQSNGFIEMSQSINAFSAIFDTRVAQTFGNNQILDSEVLQRESIYRFKTYNLYRRHEPFYLAYPECLQDKLSPEDYAQFVKLWNEVDAQKHQLFSMVPTVSLLRDAHSLRFAIHVVEIVQLDRLFFAGYFVPVDDGTGNRERCEALFLR